MDIDTNGIPEAFDTDNLHAACEVCGGIVCLSSCCPGEAGVVAPEGEDYAIKLYVHKAECLEIWLQPTVVDVAARLANGGAS